MKLRLHLWTLPRWFAAPAAACAIWLGCILTGTAGWLMALAMLSSVLVMAWGHSMNTALDWLTGIDQEDGPTSKPKSYTAGNQVIVTEQLSTEAVLANAICWLALSFAFALVVAINASWWIMLPWGLSALVTFFYSLGKLCYGCETALGLGFGPFAVMMGAAASTGFTFSDFGPAFMAGLAYGWVFGFGAEFIDQYFDADQNWDSGLRNMGALAWKAGVHPATFTAVLVALAYVIQIALVIGGYLAPLTLSTLAVMPPFVYCTLALARAKPDVKAAEVSFDNKAIMLTMFVMFLWMLALVISQEVA
ncbi:MAG: prenyltransferase [Patescibacteria group bacterium]|nr:prenyltransferase [Patescibacteria group bacterium]